ncbi:MAG: DUF423 domain-containing protein [Bdellovibrionales bacterium]|jgi:uncharacterized membrane protein YgdD (TMEM256/DUF423 family)|nr:DUF423 domain-containing protein [Bdellovibrionales bacterium]
MQVQKINKNFLMIASLLFLSAIIMDQLFFKLAYRYFIPQLTSFFKMGIMYQMLHGVVIILIGILQIVLNKNFLNKAVYIFIIGTILFSGHCYLYAFTGAHIFSSFISLGSFVLISGWILLLVLLLKLDI